MSEPTFVFDWPCGGECSRSSNEFLSFGGIPERSKGSDCKSDGYAFEGSNPSPATNKGPLLSFWTKGPYYYGGDENNGGYGTMVEPQPSKLMMRVRFPLPAPQAFDKKFFELHHSLRLALKRGDDI